MEARRKADGIEIELSPDAFGHLISCPENIVAAEGLLPFDTTGYSGGQPLAQFSRSAQIQSNSHNHTQMQMKTCMHTHTQNC